MSSDPRLSPELRPANPGNYGSRQNAPIDFVVIHTTESSRTEELRAKGAIPSAVHWFADPKAKASAHYVVGQDGRLWQTVAEGDCAWHAGNADYNRRSIGIEVEGFAFDRNTWTPEVLTALVTLCADIARRHGIPDDRRHWIGHCDVPDPKHPGKKGGAGNHEDPGPFFPWDDFLESLWLELVGPELG